MLIDQYSTCVTDGAFRRKESHPYLDFVVAETPNVFIKGISYKYSVCGLFRPKSLVLFHQVEPEAKPFPSRGVVLDALAWG